LTNVNAATLALDIASAKTLQLISADNYNLTATASGTVALLDRSGGQTFTTAQMIDGTADAIQLRVQAHSTQTAAVQTWENSSGTVVAKINGNGNTVITGLGTKFISELSAGSDTNFVSLWVGTTLALFQYPNAIKFGIQAATGQADNGAANYSMMTFGSTNHTIFGNMSAGQADLGYRMTILSANDRKQFVIRGFSSQTENLQEWQNSAGTALGWVDSTGAATFTPESATTAAGVNALTAQANSTGTAAAGFGPIVNFKAETATASTVQLQGYLRASWVTAANATRAAKLGFYASDYNGDRLGLEIEATGSAAEIYSGGNTHLKADSRKLYFGTADDAYQEFVTDHLSIKADAVTAGDFISLESDTVFVGSGTGVPYGNCWGNEIAWTQTNAAQNTWYLISDADISDGALNLVTHDGSGKLTVAKAGVYVVVWDGSAEVSIAGKHIQIGIAIDGTTQNNGINHFDLNLANSEVPLGTNGIYTLTAGQTIEAALRTTDTGTPNISIDHYNLTIHMVGG
jgi:hypothetical protein